ncbi:uncharacterized protein ACIBXB_005172 [Morphnus guianensis]
MSIPTAGGRQGSAWRDLKEATSSSPPASPLCRRGTTLCPQLCLALDQLWVLSGGTEAAGEEEEEEDGSGEGSSSLILSWPTGSCLATFEQAEGTKRAPVMRLPSITHLQQKLSRHHAMNVALISALSPEHWSSSRAAEASLLTFFLSFSLAQWRTLRARSLETLIKGQAKVWHPKGGCHLDEEGHPLGSGH